MTWLDSCDLVLIDCFIHLHYRHLINKFNALKHESLKRFFKGFEFFLTVKEGLKDTHFTGDDCSLIMSVSVLDVLVFADLIICLSSYC